MASTKKLPISENLHPSSLPLLNNNNDSKQTIHLLLSGFKPLLKSSRFPSNANL
ncbi:hypothetical protein Mapa_004157 [Marchantia paleacea]|nr:hypothetical protein Mapa_004157 [Marchantia paleacea]